MLTRIAIAFACAGLTACATSPTTTDSGRYLQILSQSGDKVIAEIDTRAGGMLDCSTQAHFVLQSRPTAKVRCSATSSTDPLPYSYVAHNQSSESDGYRPSSPYLVRASTAAVCASMRDATARPDAKVKIFEDRCGSKRS